MSIKFLSNWFLAWEGLAALFLGLWAIVRDDGSKKYADSFLRDTSIAEFFSGIFLWSANVSSKIFGKRIISWRSFLVGLLLSISIFCISYAIAVATTPYMQAQLKFTKNWSQGQGIIELHFSFYTTLALTIFALMTEFIYVVKSRVLLQFLTYKSSFLKVCAVLVADVTSTLALFTTLTPVIIMVFGYLFYYSFHKELAGLVSLPGPNDSFDWVVPISPSARLLWPASLQNYFYIASPSYVYRLLIESLWSQLLDHFREGFTRYHTLDFGLQLIQPESGDMAAQSLSRFRNAVTVFGKINPENLSKNVYRGFSIQYSLTTMLVSTFSTLIWTIFCTFIFAISKVLYNTFHAHRIFFSHLHTNPVRALAYAGICSSIAFLGVAVGLVFVAV